ncbi:MAG: nicotinamide-nucleotide amidohydrolase family protein [Spirochaetales bacterium]|nr:nicotinamide-nucleotide amidohydrolase family protein [Spirochaetales bacterium]
MLNLSKQVTLIIIGTEITDGIIQDLHIRFIADKLYPLFKGLFQIRVIPDSSDISVNIKEVLAFSDIVIITGGLGATSDDLTRFAISEAGSLDLEFNQEIWNGIEAVYGKNISKINRVQACFPKGFSPIENKVGSACGFYGWIGSTMVFSLPGPPREMNLMFDNFVLPILKKNFQTSSGDVVRGTAFLFSETHVEEFLAKYCEDEDFFWGTRTFEYGVYFYIGGRPKSELEDKLLEIIESQGGILVKAGQVELVDVVKDSIFSKKPTIFGAESCTGGLISSILTSIPGISEFFEGTGVVYSNREKARLFGIDADEIDKLGVVSVPFVDKALDCLRDRIGCDLGFFVSGEAGPTASDPALAVGTVVIGLFYGDEKITRTFYFSGNREIIRKRAACSTILLVDSLLNANKSIDKGFNCFYIK